MSVSSSMSSSTSLDWRETCPATAAQTHTTSERNGCTAEHTLWGQEERATKNTAVVPNIKCHAEITWEG